MRWLRIGCSLALCAGGVSGAYAAALEPAAERLQKIKTMKAASAARSDLGGSPQQWLGLAPDESLELIHSSRDQQGRLHQRYRQLFRGVPVHGHQIIVHAESGSPYDASGFVVRRLAADLKALAPSALTSSPLNNGLQNATQRTAVRTDVDLKQSMLARAHRSFEKTVAGDSSNWVIIKEEYAREIYITADTEARLVAVIQIFARAPGQIPKRLNLIIDEASGEILKQWDGVAHAAASGPGGNEKTGRYVFGEDFPALEVTELAAGCELSNSQVVTHDFASEEYVEVLPFIFPCYFNEGRAVNGGYAPLNDAHQFAGFAQDMFAEWAGVDIGTLPISVNVHVGVDMADAYWDGLSANFGDGDDQFYPFVDINVVPHEVSHGFTDLYSGLDYYDQSGGINESFSDIVGEAAELYVLGTVDWLIGAATVKGDGALRYFEVPSRDGVSIDHARDYEDGMDVHHSSGVFNRAFYLLANSAGWDVQSAFQTMVHANLYYWSSTTGFDEGACGVINSATDLNKNVLPVIDAFATVGVVCSTDTTDRDNDGVPDGWELINGLNPNDSADADLDADGDGLTNREEYEAGSEPRNEDTDRDGLSDREEVEDYGTSPLALDSDADGMPDLFEVTNQLNPRDASDAAEDADGDGASNLAEYQLSTDPQDASDKAEPVTDFVASFENGIPQGWIRSGTTSDTALWQRTTEWSTVGNYSLGIVGLQDNEDSVVEFSGLFPAGQLSLDFRVSSEDGYDYLSIELDGEPQYYSSGEATERAEITIPAGFHAIRIVYSKDEIEAAGFDAAWIDNVAFQITNLDRDRDGLPNTWELDNGLDPDDASDATLDSDKDGLTNLEEFAANTDPQQADTDADGLSDSAEINETLTLPTNPDSDNDGLLDGAEVAVGLDPMNSADAELDQDGDGYSNLLEIKLGTDLADAQSVPQTYRYFRDSFEDGFATDWSFQSTQRNALWEVVESWATHGNSSIAITGLGDSQTSAVGFTRVFERGVMRVDYSVSTEYEYDIFTIYVDDVAVESYSGLIVGSVLIDITEGVHSIRFEYAKDESDSEASNANSVWIDNVRFAREDPDADGDGMPTSWELGEGLDPYDPSDAALDSDFDGVTNLEEYKLGTSPLIPNVNLSVMLRKNISLIGDRVKYVLEVANAGAMEATNVVLEHSIPPKLRSSMTFSVMPSDIEISCRATAPGLVCDIPALPGGEMLAVSLDVQAPDRDEPFEFTATVRSDQQDSQADDNEESVSYGGHISIVMLMGLLGLAMARRRACNRPA